MIPNSEKGRFLKNLGGSEKFCHCHCACASRGQRSDRGYVPLPVEISGCSRGYFEGSTITIATVNPKFLEPYRGLGRTAIW